MSEERTPPAHDPVVDDPARRFVLKASLGAAAGAMIVSCFKLPLAEAEEKKSTEPQKLKAGADYKPEDHWWAYAIDTTKCIGCGACVRACKAENSVPDGYFRTWVERYLIMEDQQVFVDSPDGALNSFGKDRADLDPKKVEKAFFVPKLCNHCETSPCVQVCPVGASYLSPDGLSLVDHTSCVGCGYCVQACPYGTRFLHPTHGWADKCTLCYHRLTRGRVTACVEACPVGTRVVGNLKDPNSDVRKVLGSSRYKLIKPELGTHPKCFYIGLDEEVI